MNEPEINRISRLIGDKQHSYTIIIISTVILGIAGISLYAKLQNTKLELESCRSSCSMA